MKQVIFIDAERQGYSTNQIQNTMTVLELMAYLDQFDEDTEVYLRHDRGYTYGGITQNSFSDDYVDSDKDDEL